MRTFRILTLRDADTLAEIHAQTFEHAWSADGFASELAKSSVRAVACLGPFDDIIGFILIQQTDISAEILTFATAPNAQRHGVGTALLQEVETQLTARGCQSLMLDVAADNRPALALYEKAGFTAQGRRKAYYRRQAAPFVDAILMQRDLTGLP